MQTRQEDNKEIAELTTQLTQLINNTDNIETKRTLQQTINKMHQHQTIIQQVIKWAARPFWAQHETHNGTEILKIIDLYDIIDPLVITPQP